MMDRSQEILLSLIAAKYPFRRSRRIFSPFCYGSGFISRCSRSRPDKLEVRERDDTEHFSAFAVAEAKIIDKQDMMKLQRELVE